MSTPGGFLEPCSSTTIRPQPVRIPLPARGPFDFPAPYKTRGIRVSNVALDAGGRDCVQYGYSYWPRINAHAGQPHLLVFCPYNRNRGGPGPSLFRVDKASEQVTPLGPLFGPGHPLSWETGETWYWSRRDPHVLYCPSLERLYRYHVDTRALDTVVDVAGSGKWLWQWHTDDSDRIHSATLKNSQTYALEGAIVYREGHPGNPWSLFPPLGAMDECQIDQAGAWLLDKDNVDRIAGEDNRLIRLSDGTERLLLDQHGAGGHSDNGFGYMVAADNYNALPGAYRLWMFDAQAQPQGRLVYHTPNWDAELTHPSHVNARPGSPDTQVVVGSGASRKIQPRNNEIVGFKLDGSLIAEVVAPVLVDFHAPGGGSDDYAKLPHGSLDVTGEWFCWTANNGSAATELFLVRVPNLLGGDPGPGPVCTHCPIHCPP